MARTARKAGFQIYKYDPKFEQAFVDAGSHNWFWTFDEALKRKHELENVWSKRGVLYIIVQCDGGDK